MAHKLFRAHVWVCYKLAVEKVSGDDHGSVMVDPTEARPPGPPDLAVMGFGEGWWQGLRLSNGDNGGSSGQIQASSSTAGDDCCPCEL
ncbi:hypothetical protein E2562_002346, partial [Oryza meyeriana var. granulata]